MRICICDDDPTAVECLSDYIHDFLGKSLIKASDIALFKDGSSLLEDQGRKDIVFLDIEMPGINGVYVGQELAKRNKNIIIFIVTSYPEYLDDAMRFHAFRYLSKPIDKQRLFRNLKDALDLYANITARLPIETKGGVHSILTSHIIYIEAVEHTVVIHTIKEDYRAVKNMQYWLNQLPSGVFFQSHRSFIVNFAYVTDFDHSVVHLYHNQFTAYLTRRKYTAFKNAYLLYMEAH